MAFSLGHIACLRSVVAAATNEGFLSIDHFAPLEHVEFMVGSWPSNVARTCTVFLILASSTALVQCTDLSCGSTRTYTLPRVYVVSLGLIGTNLPQC